MATPIEFGLFGPTGAETARGHAFAPALHRAIAIARDSFSSLWFADHLMFGDQDIHEAWTLLSYAAALAPDLQLGHLVNCNSYRPPALVAKMSASLQSLSGGRFVLGYGAGWHKDEYVAYGYAFPSAATRIAMMEEGLQVIKAMWRDEQPSYQGRYYQIENARCEPRPQPVPPIMVGGAGEQRTLRAVARHADWWNLYNRQADVAGHKLAVLAAHCQAEGRDVATIRKTWSGPVIIDRDHRAALERAAARNLTGDRPPIAGDPAAVTEQIEALVALGFDLFQVESSRFPDTSDIELFAERVMPAFR